MKFFSKINLISIKSVEYIAAEFEDNGLEERSQQELEEEFLLRWVSIFDNEFSPVRYYPDTIHWGIVKK